MPKVEVNGLTVHYQQMGRGHDLVMIHGLFANLAFWYLSVFPELTRDFRVTVYDLRGHGYSEMPQRGYTSSDMAADLHALLDHLQVEQAHVVGHSFGGAVALHYAVLHSERVQSLTLADAQVPSLQPALPPRNTLRAKLLRIRLQRAGIEVPEDLPRVAYGFFEEMARLHRWGRGRKPRASSRPTLLDGWSGNSLLAKRWSQLVHTTSAPKELCDASSLPVERIRQVTKPTMAIFGECSSCLSTLYGLEENLPNLSKVIIPRVGHFHPIVKPRAFVRKLRQFLLGFVGERASG